MGKVSLFVRYRLMRDFLISLGDWQFRDLRIMIIGHRATHYRLDSLLNNVPLKLAITRPWQWQPGWNYAGDSVTYDRLLSG
jgi:hypothetical protein